MVRNGEIDSTVSVILAGELRVSALISLSAMPLSTACWLRLRWKSPSANCLRWRTKVSASSPSMLWVPAVNWWPSASKSWGTCTSMPPSVSTMPSMPSKSIRATWSTGTPT